MREEHRVGIEYLKDVTTLTQRVRTAHLTMGQFESADFQWWWRTPRPTDDIPQLFWCDDDGRPAAAVVATDWGDGISLDPITMPDATPEWVAHVVERGLTHAKEAGFHEVDVVIDRQDNTMADVLASHGFTAMEDELVESWLTATARPATTPLHPGYRLVSRVDTLPSPHHMIRHSGPDVEVRLGQTTLYRRDLDLLVLDDHDTVAAYAMFWFDPETATGLVEPMRTEDEHQRRGLARRLLTAGIDLLAEAGAERIKICFKSNHAPSRDLYLSVGFEQVKQCALVTRAS